jgi:hypothetical protein
MSRFPLHRESNDRHQTFVIVVAWFFTLLGAATSLKIIGQLIIAFCTKSFDYIMSTYTFVLEVELLFSTTAFIIGLGMLNRRANALRNSIVALWLYLLWHAGALTFGLIKVWLETTRMERVALDMPELVQGSFRSGQAYMIYGTIGSALTIAVCYWQARRLSLPIVKNAYEA